jgi:hypothetical protein
VHLARKVVCRRLGGRVVPAQVVNAVGEVDVFLVEDGSPLKGRLIVTVVSLLLLL